MGASAGPYEGEVPTGMLNLLSSAEDKADRNKKMRRKTTLFTS